MLIPTKCLAFQISWCWTIFWSWGLLTKIKHVFKKGLNLTPSGNTVSLSSTMKLPLRKKLCVICQIADRNVCCGGQLVYKQYHSQCSHWQLCHEHCEWLLIIQGSCVKEVKGPLLIFKCLLNWCHGTPSLHLPTLANAERAKTQERRPSQRKIKNLFGGLLNQSTVTRLNLLQRLKKNLSCGLQLYISHWASIQNLHGQNLRFRFGTPLIHQVLYCTSDTSCLFIKYLR